METLHMKPTFLNHKKPLICCMLPTAAPDEVIETIKKAHDEGAEAFGFQLECWEPGYLNEECFRNVFKHCLGKPIYVTSYRGRSNHGKTDDECVELLFTALRAGATLVDVMADCFDPQPYEITYNEEAVAKQKALIERLHAAGAEVIMSSHTHTHIGEDELVRYAKAQRERGADICKIVNVDCSESDTDEDFRAILRIKNEVGGHFLFLSAGGNSHLVRRVGTSLGVCMWLCAQSYAPDVKYSIQPLIGSMKTFKDELFCDC